MKIALIIFFLFLVSCYSTNQTYNTENIQPIIGGESVSSAEYPFYVQILISQKNGLTHLCGATLIRSKWVLTAAHCVYQLKKEKLFLVRETQSVKGDGGEILKIQDIFIHPEFDRVLLKNDIALIQLENPSFLNIKMSFEFNQKFENNLNLIGWGYTSYPSTSPLSLQILRSIQVAAIKECLFHPEWQDNHPIQPGMMCIYTHMDEAANCIGDSGGPLFFVDASNEIHLVGITSWGSACRKMKKWNYAGFSEVSFYRDWILDTIRLHF